MTEDSDRYRAEVEATKRAIDQWSKKNGSVVNENATNYFGFNTTAGKNVKTSKNKFAEWKETYKSLKEAQNNTPDEIYPTYDPDYEKVKTQLVQTMPSLGDDASPSPNEPVRVTPDFSDGSKIRQLAEYKKKIEALERALHDASLNGDKKEAGKFEKDLKKTRHDFHKLSGELTPSPVYTDNT